MVDYREFSRQIKEKYPEYQDVDDLKLANAMIEKYPEYKPQVTFENAELPTIQLNEDGTEKKVLRGQVSKRVDLTPSGIANKASSLLLNSPFADIGSLYDVIQKRPIGTTFNNAIQQDEAIMDKLNQDKGIKNALNRGNFINDMIAYTALPQANVFKGTGFGASLGNSALTGLGQGSLIGGLEGLKNDGLQGLGSGAIGGGLVGGLIGGGLPLIGKGIPTISKKVLKGMAQIEPETIEQVIKPNSKAFQLNSNAKLMDFANNVTNRVRNTYNDILGKAGENVRAAASKLDEGGQRININDIFDDMNAVHNQYQYGNGNIIDDVNPNLHRNTKELVTSRLEPLNDMYAYINQNNKPNLYSKAKENEAYDILSKAVNKPINWLKSQLKAVTGNKGVAKRAESIEELLDKVDDKLDVSKSSNYGDLDYRYYDNRFLNGDDANAGYNLARQAYDDIVNNNFVNEARDPMIRVLDSAEQDYRVLLRQVLENARNENVYAGALDKLENITRNLPDELKEQYATRLATDLDRIYQGRNTISPYELLGIRRSASEKIPSFEQGAGRINDYKKQLYGKITERLHNISPELAKADSEFSRIAKFKDKEGTKRILQTGDKIDTATTALDNFNTSYSKGNTNKNVQDLENLFVREGYEPFINDIEDIVAARDLNKLNNTGLGSLADVAKNVLVRPSLMGLQAINRTPLPQVFNGLGNVTQKTFIPFTYNLPRLFNQDY